MLSINQSSAPHRRQNSTPTANNVSSEFPFLPITPTHSACSHQRGMSLNHQAYSHKTQNNQQQETGIPITNQKGPSRQPVMQEAQLRFLNRPDQYDHSELIDLKKLESVYTVMQRPPSPSYQQSSITSDTSHPNSMHSHYPHTHFDAFARSNFDVFAPSSLDSSSNVLNGLGTVFGTNSAYNMNTDRGFEDMDISTTQPSQSPPQPHTPPHQTTTSYFPITPSSTPTVRKSGQGRSSQAPRDMQDCRSPQQIMDGQFVTPMKRGSSYQDIFSNVNFFADNPQLPSPPNTVPLRSSKRFDVAPVPTPNFYDMSAFGIDFTVNSNTYDSSNYSPMTNQVPSEVSSFNTSPILEPMDLFSAVNNIVPANTKSKSRNRQLRASHGVRDLATNGPHKEQEKSRSQSIPNINLDPQCTVIPEDTGITQEEIAAFIGTAEDNQWMCLFQECKRLFKRKENIKAHVQTHLNDRPYKCGICKKPFVRHHDLKRHARIHSEQKDYKCECGERFGRMDALTRHKQRRICHGAFEGSPRKENKRGRPKKVHRPDSEERLEKAAKTRQRVLEKKLLASSASASPDFPSLSPRQQANLLDLSPKRGSVGSISEEAEDDEGMLLTQSLQEPNMVVRIGTPPELDISSSSPAASKQVDIERDLESFPDNYAAFPSLESTCNPGDLFDLTSQDFYIPGDEDLGEHGFRRIQRQHLHNEDFGREFFIDHTAGRDIKGTLVSAGFVPRYGQDPVISGNNNPWSDDFMKDLDSFI